MTMRVNLIHSKLYIFLKKYTKTKHTEKKKKLFTRTVQVNCTVGVHSARKRRISKSRQELLRQIRVQNMNLHGSHQN